MKKEPYKTYGIIGSSLKHSLSPIIHNHFFAQRGLPYIYITIEVGHGRLADAMLGIKALGFHGINVTFPYKEAVIPFLDESAPTANRAGAVNTIKNINGRLVGYNTDIFGIRRALDDQLHIELKGGEAIILGAGGVARAGITELRRRGIRRIWLFSRSPQKAKKTMSAFCNQTRQFNLEVWPMDEIENFSPESQPVLLFNATSARPALLRSIIQVLSKNGILRTAKILDMNYGPRALPPGSIPTSSRYFDGLYTLAAQAGESFRIWTGKQLEPKVVFEFLQQR